MSTAARRLIIATVAIVAAVGLLVAFFDWNLLKEPIARQVSARLDRPVRMGSIDAHVLSLAPRVRLDDLELGNPGWAGAGRMARAERVEARVSLWPLLRGRIDVRSLEVDGAELNLLRDVSGRANWQFGRGGAEDSGGSAPLAHIRHLVIRNARLAIRDEQRGLTFEGVVAAEESAEHGGDRPFLLSVDGKLNGEPLQAQLRGASLESARAGTEYAFDLHLTSASTHLDAQGVMPKPFDAARAKGQFTLSGYDMADLWYLTGLAMPSTPPYRVKSRYTRSGSHIRLDDLAGTIGDSDLKGDVAIDLSGERPNLTAKLTATAFDLDDLGVALGGPPSVRLGETASPTQVRLAREMAAKRRLFPDTPLEFRRLQRMNAAVTLEAGKVTARKIPLRRFSMRLLLNGGHLILDPIRFDFPQGRLGGYLWIDGTGGQPVTFLDARLTGMQLGQFKPRESRTPPLEGTLQGRLILRGTGESVHEIVSSASGSLTAVVPQGEVRAAFAELTGINVARGLGLLLADDEEKTTVRCGIADFKLDSGVLQTRTLLFDTQDVLITGKGDVQLQSERFDLIVQGRPKKLRLLRLKAPIAIRGPLRKPDIGVDAGNAVTQGGLAAALAALTAPLAAVLAFVDPGLEEDANCGALLTEAKRDGVPVRGGQF